MMNKKYKVLQTITTIEGTLYEGDIVIVDDKENNRRSGGDIRVRDSMGRIWYVERQILKSMGGK